MIKLSWIAEVILNIYYAGRPKEGKKLVIEDFEQMVRMANASIMRKIYFDLLATGDVFDYFGYQLEQKEYILPEKDKRGRRVLIFDEGEGVLRLPKGLGIFSIFPVSEEEDFGQPISAVIPGSNALFSGADFDDIMKYENRGSRLTFYNVPDCIEKVEVDGIHTGEDIQVPLDSAFDIINLVLMTVLKTINVPIDKTNDGDPNVLNIKQQLAPKSTI